VVLCADSHGRRETILQMLAEHRIAPDAHTESITTFLESDARFAITVASLSSGFEIPAQGLIFLTENDLYPGHGGTAKRGRRDQERASNVEAMVRDLSELREGDPVVHAQHGIGRYHGLVNLDMGEGEMEFLYLEYGNKTTLYVPVAQLHVIARYSGTDPDSACTTSP
jgi:transcription-repair coupling factor (superfamily II helicase)